MMQAKNGSNKKKTNNYNKKQNRAFFSCSLYICSLMFTHKIRENYNFMSTLETLIYLYTHIYSYTFTSEVYSL